jgi:hypothetical protein
VHRISAVALLAELTYWQGPKRREKEVKKKKRDGGVKAERHRRRKQTERDTKETETDREGMKK